MAGVFGQTAPESGTPILAPYDALDVSVVAGHARAANRARHKQTTAAGEHEPDGSVGVARVPSGTLKKEAYERIGAQFGMTPEPVKYLVA